MAPPGVRATGSIHSSYETSSWLGNLSQMDIWDNWIHFTFFPWSILGTSANTLLGPFSAGIWGTLLNPRALDRPGEYKFGGNWLCAVAATVWHSLQAHTHTYKGYIKLVWGHRVESQGLYHQGSHWRVGMRLGIMGTHCGTVLDKGCWTVAIGELLSEGNCWAKL